MPKKILSILLYALIVPLLVFIGIFVFNGKLYSWIILSVTAAACIPFFLSFENGAASSKKIMTVSVMTAISVVGRMLFAPLPGFKPVTAIVVIAAMYFGRETGFLTGALSAVISNFYFGQGPWTPLQMLTWGIIGYLAGILASPLKQSKLFLTVYAVFSGILFSMIMDIWTVVWWDNTITLSRYIAAVISSSGFTAIYAVSNVVFLLALNKITGKKLERIKIKYGF